MCRSDSTREATVPPDISPGIPTVPGTVEDRARLRTRRAAPRARHRPARPHTRTNEAQLTMQIQNAPDVELASTKQSRGIPARTQGLRFAKLVEEEQPSSLDVYGRQQPGCKDSCCCCWVKALTSMAVGVAVFLLALIVLLPPTQTSMDAPAPPATPMPVPPHPTSPPPISSPWPPRHPHHGKHHRSKPPTQAMPPTQHQPPMPPPPMPGAIRALNQRFAKLPWEVEWGADGTLPDAGILFHTFDGWEQTGAAWKPGTNGPGALEQSGSMVFAAQRVPGEPIPLFGDRRSGGIIFRPGASTKITCGKAKDSAGTCAVWHPPGISPWCPSISGDIPGRAVWTEPGDTCGYAWRPADIGHYLQRLTAWQQHWQRLSYNEIIIDAPHWRAHLPDAVEAIVGDRAIYDAFIANYNLAPERVPFVTLDRTNWDAPFS